MSAGDSEDRDVDAGGTAGGEDTGAAFDAPVTAGVAPASVGGEELGEDTGAAFDAPATGAQEPGGVGGGGEAS